MIKATAAAAALALVAGGAHAATIDVDFEVGALVSDPTDVGSSWDFGGINFSSTQGLFVVGVGAPQDAFVNDDGVADTPADMGAFGEVFLTNDFGNGTAGGAGQANMTLTFGSQISDLTFQIADIDGSGNDEETFVVEYLLGTTLVGTQSVRANDVVGDGAVTTFNFSGGIFDTVVINGTDPGNNRNIGWGIDNIHATVVPLPAGMVLTLTALGGLGLLRARRKA